MKNILRLGILAITLAALAGCTPRVHGATAILPTQPGDTSNVWIYLHTSDDEADGVYRCYDVDQKPVCKRAKVSQ